jgi:hypothetical protein
MRRWIWILIALAVLVAVVADGPSSVTRFLEIDGCLDRGGVWNYDNDVCEGG